MTTAVCPTCRTPVDAHWFSRSEITWWKCRECGLRFVHPQPDDATLDRLNEAAYHGPASDGSETKTAIWDERARALTRAGGSGRLLDVGCGRGIGRL